MGKESVIFRTDRLGVSRVQSVLQYPIGATPLEAQTAALRRVSVPNSKSDLAGHCAP